MPHDLGKPLLRLNDPTDAPRRRSGGGGGDARSFTRAAQVANHGPFFKQLAEVLDGDNPALELRANPDSLAPERLLVFEVTGSVKDFAKAASRIAGLEFTGEEELGADEHDKNPEFYLLVPQLGALREILSLWDGWETNGTVPRNYTPWRDLFLQLRAVRPWGPADRVSPQNREYFEAVVDGAPDDFAVRIEIELVFRAAAEARQRAEQEVAAAVIASGGTIIHRCVHPAFAYHALLVDVPAAEVRRFCALNPESLAGVDPIGSIVPQSVGVPLEVGDSLPIDPVHPQPANAEPIAAIFDAVPLQAHPLLAGRLVVDDPANLEARAVGSRVHGTAMASLAVHGDLNDPASPISRRVYFRPVMFAPAFGGEIFADDRLVIDTVVEAVMRMRAEGGTQVFIVNLSLGDTTRPFAGNISAWGKALDYLAYQYGILFLVSAGNVAGGLTLEGHADVPTFHAAEVGVRNASVLRALDAIKADRRLLAPADSLNALTIGSWHRDAVANAFAGASPFAPYIDQDMPNISSRLGLGHRRSTKPDILLAGGRQPVLFDPMAQGLVMGSHPNPSRYWGLKVAAPTGDAATGTHFTIGTSGANALATHTAHRIHDALERAYPQLIETMALGHKAALIKALLVHCASWRDVEQFIRPIVDPELTLNHEHWRREVCRHLGYGFVDPEDAIACAGDRATMWATGTLGLEGSTVFNVPVPVALAGSPAHREVRATLAWLAPVRPGHLAYRAIKLKINALGGEDLGAFGVATMNSQPTNSQSESGTIIHRRWRDARIGNFEDGATMPIHIQREKDQGTPIDEPIPFGLAVTIEMPGMQEIYTQALQGIDLKPQVQVPV
ncbi:S8 family peptidase [Sphingobium rhizovicinum]|uniref:S8 family peptidase n=1 Tax=Sphingobium rhizovicinum TaxID=432308 RepID=A0ABV7NMV1_9SPHN